MAAESELAPECTLTKFLLTRLLGGSGEQVSGGYLAYRAQPL